jgi:4-hydroxy-tetrahydrodipicolinate synthase
MMNTQLSSGFYTALGTPVNPDGSLDGNSFSKQIDDQITAGASGVLIMGSMGIEAYIRNSDYPEVARKGAEAVAGRCPVFVGAMDTSISRVLDRIESIKSLPIDGVVLTVPYYNTLSQEEVFLFYQAVAEKSPYPVYMYDLAVVTKTKISIETAAKIMRTIPNVKGIKSADLVLARVLGNMLKETGSENQFSIMYSGLDTFDVVYGYGITKQLDGMFSCTPTLANRLYKALEADDSVAAAKNLDSIKRIRDTFVSLGVFPAFTAAMNLLGYPGRYHPDYSCELEKDGINTIHEALEKESLL